MIKVPFTKYYQRPQNLMSYLPTAQNEELVVNVLFNSKTKFSKKIYIKLNK